MKRFLLALLLCLTVIPAAGQRSPTRCKGFRPGHQKWAWLDANCHAHERQELDEILRRHRLWIRKYWTEIQSDLKSFNGLPNDALSDVLRAHLAGATLIGASLESADLIDVDLSNADLTDAHLNGADLTEADLTGADLTGADLSESNLIGSQLAQASLSRPETDLSNADLTHADLTGADLTEADMTAADLTEADLTRADLSETDLTETDLTGAHLTKAYLTGAHLNNGADLRSADLTEADLNSTEFVNAFLQAADLTGADFQRADLSGAYLDKANLTGAYLGYADLPDAYLGESDLTNADIRYANLARAWLHGTDFSQANLLQTDLGQADLTESKLWNALFEPKVLPALNGIARAAGLETIRWDDRPRPTPIENLKVTTTPTPIENLKVTTAPTPSHLWFVLHHNGWYRLHEWAESQDDSREQATSGSPLQILDLIKGLHDAHYREAEAAVNLAYHRRIETWWEVAVFDWTCAWGVDWARPLWIVLGMGGVRTVVYWGLLRFGRRSKARRVAGSNQHSDSYDGVGTKAARKTSRSRRWSELYVVTSRRGKERRWPVGRNYDPPPWIHLPLPRRRHWLVRLPVELACSVPARLGWEMPLFLTAAVFSVMSVVNLGVQGLDLGRWLRMVQRREFDLKARGTVRLLAGVQSVTSFLLLALSAYVLLVQPIGE